MSSMQKKRLEALTGSNSVVPERDNEEVQASHHFLSVGPGPYARREQ